MREKVRVFQDKEKGKIYHIREYDMDKVLYAIDSGKSGGAVHYLFLDYDENYPNNVLELMWVLGLKRGLIVESSKGKWWFISFSPLPKEVIFNVLWNNPYIDKGHAGCFLRFRQNSLRISEKTIGSGYPKIRRTLLNGGAENFYNYYAEESFRELLQMGVTG